MLSIQQAKQFGVLDKQKLVVPYQVPFLAREVGGDLMGGVYASTASGGRSRTSIRSPRCSSTEFEKKYGYKPEWGAQHLLPAVRDVGRTPSRRPAPSIRRKSSRPTRSGQKMQSMVGEVHFRPEDHQLVRPVIIVRGKKTADMKGKEDYWEVLEILPGEPLMQKPDAFGCKLGDYT